MHRKLLEPPVLGTERLLLRMAEESDIPAILKYLSENRAHFAPWDPPQPRNFETLEHWQERIRSQHEDFESDRAVRFLMFGLSEPDRVLGSISLSAIQRGPAQYCNLGYQIAETEQGKGLMTEGLRAVLEFAFGPLHLHRVAANYVPHNVRSGAVLRRLGFNVDGYARDYLRIGGRWQDHILTSLTNPNWQPLED